MAGEVLIVPEYEPDTLAQVISDTWMRYNTARLNWLSEKDELRAYLFATDTTKTTNSKLPWKNSTVTPKLTQLRDNLHANYMAALFPNERWFVWEAEDRDSVTMEKRTAIEAYMRKKLKESQFDLTVSALVLDYIDYGNVFAGHEFVSITKTDPVTGEVSEVYVGPRAMRVSPLDVVINPNASTFKDSPFIRRYLRTLGDIHKDMKQLVADNFDEAVLHKASNLRRTYRDYIDQLKSQGLMVDGFGSLEEYFTSGTVEFIEFRGDLYDEKTGEFYHDYVVTIVDRRWVARRAPNTSWTGSRPFYHCGWRLRPDNLWAQGPLDQLIGMQYRIDHLENLKADVFDLIAHPVVKVKGDTVEDFDWGPGTVIHCGVDGDVEVISPAAAALQADMQINELMSRMEELAGAPRQAMGIRTPGEKTKYEVQVLENGAGRIFQSKVNWFEKNIVEPLLNSMLEEATRHLGAKERVKVVDPDLGIETFIDITKDDLVGPGRLSAMGARHFAEQARFVQELTQTMQAVQAMPTVQPHFSGKAAARALEENLGWKRYGIVKDNVAVAEQLETQRLSNAAQESAEVEAGLPAEMQPEDFMAPEGAPDLGELPQ